MRYRVAVLGLVASAAVVSLLSPADPRQERLARHINLGKAFYENPATPKEAVEEFRQALALNPNAARERLNYGLALLRAGATKEGVAELEAARRLDPKLPHPYFNLGVVFKKEGDFARSVQEFQQMIRLVPEEPVSHYNLGALLKLEGKTDQAIAEFQTAARLDPTLAAPHFQLFNVFRTSNRPGDAQRELAIFQEIKKRQAALGITEDIDWCYYAEILETIQPAPAEAATPVEVVFTDQQLGAVAGENPGILVLDADADGRVDVLAWSSRGATLFRNTPKGFAATAVAGAAGPLAAGDFNNDGLPDLCAGARLYTNRQGSFSAAGQPVLPGAFRQCLWVDYDHDYDLDLLLLGSSQGLARNNGDGAFADATASFPFVAGPALAGVALELGENSGFDIVVAYQNRPAVVYRDRKAGRYEAQPLEVTLSGALEAGDFNQDGFLDVAALDPAGVSFLENQRGVLRAGPRLPKPGAAFADFQNRGRADLLAGAEMLVHRAGYTWELGKLRGVAGAWAAAAAADFTGDGRADVAGVRPDGAVHLLRNVTPIKNTWMRVALTGVKNLKLAEGARVEVKAGASYQKRVYHGAPLVFGLGSYTQADAVRITWPNGLIQNEVRQNPGSYNYKEAQRLSGSCPMIFTWNGERFEFISDVLGVAPLGVFFPLDHDEYVQIPGRSLAPRQGFYDVRITEELREVSYLDQVRLVAVDHPGAVEIFTNDKFQGPPFPQFRLFGVKRRIYPSRAVDHQGRQVLDRILSRDGRTIDGFGRQPDGRAESHWVTLEFPEGGEVLYLHGWVDWADGSTFVAASQSNSRPLFAPRLEALDAGGRWVTVLEDMGMPAGKPKTIAVDLRGKLPRGWRRLRISTGMCVYWDEIFLGETAGAPETRLTPLEAAGADLRFRGFSALRVDPQRRRPEHFEYSVVRPAAMWNPTPGLYTRYGEVGELLGGVDDGFVIMGSGDELRLLFRAAALPRLPEGWRRDFLLHVDGWAKDADPNTAFGSTVEPLPFHAMRSYPDPETPAVKERSYQTRPALRLIRPLVAHEKGY